MYVFVKKINYFSKLERYKLLALSVSMPMYYLDLFSGGMGWEKGVA